MMKKFVALTLVACLNFTYASKIVDMLEKQTGQKITLLKTQALSQDSNLQLLTLKEQTSGYKIVAIANKQESVFLPITSSFFTNNDKDRDLVIREFQSASTYNATFKTQEAVKKAIATLPNDYIIHLKGKSNKKLFYIVSDPLCPHCQVELNNLNEKLEQGDVKMIPIGMMGDDSVNKVAEIYSKIKTAKTDSEKIAILKKAYNDKYKAPKAQAKEATAVQEVARILTGKGKVEMTPYIIEEDL